MKILMYGWEFPPQISGGLGIACFEMTRALRQLGHEIMFVLPRLKPGVDPSSHVRLVGANVVDSDFEETAYESLLKGSGVHLESIPALLHPYLTQSVYSAHLESIRMLESIRQSSTTSHQLEFTGEYGPDLMSEVARYALVAGKMASLHAHDVIHVHDWLTMLAGLDARRQSGKPLVVHVHALEFDRSGEHINQAIYDIERYGMENADRVVAVSHYTKDIIVRRYGVDPAKIEVVHNAIARANHRPDPASKIRTSEKIVLFLGRITFQKGPDYFVEAAAKVAAHRSHVRFVMAGSGDMAPRLIERVAALRLGQRLHFTGFLQSAAVERIYRMSDVYVMPSVSEPFGLSPLEAMCYDVPVIISRRSGVAEILTHALKVDFWDIDELANKIIALVDHPPLREELLQQGARDLKGIQWKNSAGKLEDVYRLVAYQRNN